MINPHRQPGVGVKSFLAMALAWLGLAYLVSQAITKLPVWAVVLSVLMFATPIALAGAYSSAVAQAQAVSYYKSGGWAYRFLSWRLIRTLLWILWGLISSLFMLLQLSLYTELEWSALSAVIPVFWLVHAKCRRFLSSELKKPYLITNYALVWSRWACPILMLAIYGGIIFAFGGMENYASLADALIAKRANIPVHSGSAVVDVALRFMTFADGFRSYFGGMLAPLGAHLPLLLTILGGAVVFFNASTTLSCFVIQSAEFRRLFGAITDEDLPPPLRKSDMAVASAIIAIMVLFIYVPGFAVLEEGIRSNPALMAAIEAIERKAESIDDALYRPGTIAELNLARAIAAGKFNASKEILDRQVDAAFDEMNGNVDRYLDWYYSLPAEYVRMTKIMTGQIEGYMETKFVELIQQGGALPALSKAMSSTIATHQQAASEHQRAVTTILEKNRLTADGSRTKIMQSASMNNLVAMPIHLDLVELNKRAAAGTVAAGVGAIVTAKVVGKGVIKVGAKAISKVVISKAGGAAAGAATGAALGSVAPVIGTVIGGILGGIAGGVLVDKTLLTLEEAISRDNFKRELLLAIQEARIEFKAILFDTK